MKILIVGKFYTEAFGRHIAETLEAMGHTVFRYSPGINLSRSRSLIGRGVHGVRTALYDMATKVPAIKHYSSRGIFTILKREQIDLTIVTHDFLLAEEVSKIKTVSKTPVVLWMPDAISSCGRFMFLNASFDALFFKDPYMVSVFKSDLGATAYYLPECCNPVYHKPVKITEEDARTYGCDITTAGNLSPNREAFFRQLAGYKVKIWGPPAPVWMDVSKIKEMLVPKTIFNEEKAKAFGAAKIVLNNLHPGEVWGLNCRSFEIPACGGFEMVNWRPGLRQLFDEGKEVVAFRGVKDLKEKVDYYLSHDQERKIISLAGQKRALREHTYESRLKLLLETVFSGKKGFPLPDIEYKNSI